MKNSNRAARKKKKKRCEKRAKPTIWGKKKIGLKQFFLEDDFPKKHFILGLKTRQSLIFSLPK